MRKLVRWQLISMKKRLTFPNNKDTAKLMLLSMIVVPRCQRNTVLQIISQIISQIIAQMISFVVNKFLCYTLVASIKSTLPEQVHCVPRVRCRSDRRATCDEIFD